MHKVLLAFLECSLHTNALHVYPFNEHSHPMRRCHYSHFIEENTANQKDCHLPKDRELGGEETEFPTEHTDSRTHPSDTFRNISMKTWWKQNKKMFDNHS